MWIYACSYILLCYCALSKSENPSVPKDLQDAMKNQTQEEHFSCMEDLVVCLRSHKILLSNVDGMTENIAAEIIEHPPDISPNKTKVCGMNKHNSVQQFDSVCDIVYTNCVLDQNNFWTYIGDGDCAEIMKQAESVPPREISTMTTKNWDEPPPEITIEPASQHPGVR